MPPWLQAKMSDMYDLMHWFFFLILEKLLRALLDLSTHKTAITSCNKSEKLNTLIFKNTWNLLTTSKQLELELQLTSELDFDLQDTEDWGRKWIVHFNAGKT